MKNGGGKTLLEKGYWLPGKMLTKRKGRFSIESQRRISKQQMESKGCMNIVSIITTPITTLV